jgi:hypothetical protein
VGSPGSQRPADDHLPLPSDTASTTAPMPTAEFHPLQVMTCSCRAPNAGQRSPAWDGGRRQPSAASQARLPMDWAATVAPFGSNLQPGESAHPGYFAASWASRPAGVRELGPRVANATSRRPSCRSRRRGRLVWATPSGGGRRVGRCAGRCAERPYEIRTWLPPLSPSDGSRHSLGLPPPCGPRSAPTAAPSRRRPPAAPG